MNNLSFNLLIEYIFSFASPLPGRLRKVELAAHFRYTDPYDMKEIFTDDVLVQMGLTRKQYNSIKTFNPDQTKFIYKMLDLKYLYHDKLLKRKK